MTRWHWVCQGMSQPRSYKMITAICYLLGQLNVSAHVGIVISIGACKESAIIGFAKNFTFKDGSVCRFLTGCQPG